MISVFGSDIGATEVSAADEVMHSQWMGFGRKVEEFEKKFAVHAKMKDSVMVDSGSNGLFLALSLLNLPKGSEVIVPSFTWVACAQSIRMAGLVPKFCDVDLVSMSVSASTIASQISSKTSAIMMVHYAGWPVNVDTLAGFGLPIIEDAAHAVDSLSNGRLCGTMGTVGVFSFDAVKNIAVGEGGALLSNDSELLARARELRYCGIGKSGFDQAANATAGQGMWWEYPISDSFIKMLPTNVAAAIGLVQLGRLSELQARRKEIWNFYQQELVEIPGLVCPQEASAGDRHSYFTYAIRASNRDALARYLLEKEVYSTLRYHPLHLSPIFGESEAFLPNTMVLANEVLNIPLHPRLTDSEVSRVVELIKSFYL